MSNKKKLIGASLAAAAALSFAIIPFTTASASTQTVPCYGVNACKGQSVCQTATNACKGQNSCKGKGQLMKTKEQCLKMGGSTEQPR